MATHQTATAASDCAACDSPIAAGDPVTVFLSLEGNGQQIWHRDCWNREMPWPTALNYGVVAR